MTEFKTTSFGKAFLSMLIGFIPFIVFGLLGIGIRYIFDNIISGVITFFTLSVMFILISWISEKIKKDEKKIEDKKG